MADENAYLLTEHQLNNIKSWFSRYVRSFYSSDPVIQQAVALKEDHSLRVCNEILNIGKKLDLNSNNLRLAETIALLHDIGRFEQVTRYQTFVDRKSENHAELGVKVLRQEKPLAVLEEETQGLILKAILYHNRMNIPENESRVCIYFSKLIRDADKLDIFNLFADYYYTPAEARNSAVELDLPDIPIVSDEVLTGLHEGKMIGMQQLKSLNDFKLLQLAWVYDINFQPTFQMIQERGYLEKIRDTLPAEERIGHIYNQLSKHLKKFSEFGDARPLSLIE